jgi:hypothetical protein
VSIKKSTESGYSPREPRAIPNDDLSQFQKTSNCMKLFIDHIFANKANIENNLLKRFNLTGNDVFSKSPISKERLEDLGAANNNDAYFKKIIQFKVRYRTKEIYFETR